MNKPLSLAVATLATGLMLGAALALANDAPADGEPRDRLSVSKTEAGLPVVPRGKRNGDEVLARVCSEGNGPLEDMLRLIGDRVPLSDAQAPLFDAFRDAALTAQADYVEACIATQPAAAWAEELDLTDRLRIRIGIETARAAALNAVMPAFEALYESLDETQKAVLDPALPVAEGHGSPAAEPHAPLAAGPFDI
jgi:hypothetical protein